VRSYARQEIHDRIAPRQVLGARYDLGDVAECRTSSEATVSHIKRSLTFASSGPSSPVRVGVPGST
jgi:hypothetical protein